MTEHDDMPKEAASQGIDMTYDEFVAALKAFCLDHGFEIAGTCGAEGIYGEITVYKIGDTPGWDKWDRNRFNFEDGVVRK